MAHLLRLGGTCVNVGCIPKKIMHYAGLLGHRLRETNALGWALGEHADEGKSHDWRTLVRNVGDYIKGLNFNYKVRRRGGRKNTGRGGDQQHSRCRPASG